MFELLDILSSSTTNCIGAVLVSAFITAPAAFTLAVSVTSAFGSILLSLFLSAVDIRPAVVVVAVSVRDATAIGSPLLSNCNTLLSRSAFAGSSMLISSGSCSGACSDRSAFSFICCAIIRLVSKSFSNDAAVSEPATE